MVIIIIIKYSECVVWDHQGLSSDTIMVQSEDSLKIHVFYVFNQHTHYIFINKNLIY